MVGKSWEELAGVGSSWELGGVERSRKLGQHPHCGLKILVVCAAVRFVAFKVFSTNKLPVNDCSELSSCQLPVFSM